MKEILVVASSCKANQAKAIRAFCGYHLTLCLSFSSIFFFVSLIWSFEFNSNRNWIGFQIAGVDNQFDFVFGSFLNLQGLLWVRISGLYIHFMLEILHICDILDFACKSIWSIFLWSTFICMRFCCMFCRLRLLCTHVRCFSRC